VLVQAGEKMMSDKLMRDKTERAIDLAHTISEDGMFNDFHGLSLLMIY
jgi:hypothetical protein